MKACLRPTSKWTNYSPYVEPVVKKKPTRGITSRMTNREKVLFVGRDPHLLPWYLEWKRKHKLRRGHVEQGRSQGAGR